MDAVAEHALDVLAATLHGVAREREARVTHSADRAFEFAMPLGGILGSRFADCLANCDT
jgi:hypothetical protein